MSLSWCFWIQRVQYRSNNTTKLIFSWIVWVWTSSGLNNTPPINNNSNTTLLTKIHKIKDKNIHIQRKIGKYYTNYNAKNLMSGFNWHLSVCTTCLFFGVFLNEFCTNSLNFWISLTLNQCLFYASVVSVRNTNHRALVCAVN